MSDVRQVGTRAELLSLPRGAAAGGPVALVPTMGALHEGHAALIRAAREATHGPVVVSVFVNPLQFAPGEDLDRYPRTLDADLEVCAGAGADVVFTPSVAEMYPDGVSTGATDAVSVDAGPLGTILEGASRPTHFRGVLTVVAKLFGLVRPDLAFFGEKDYQQLVLIEQMARELCLGVDVCGVETVRDADGLARSSRNQYLSDEERTVALALSRALSAARERAAYGVPSARWAAMKVLTGEPGLDLDYLALRSEDLTVDLSEEPDLPTTTGRVLVAARVGNTRLIDNMPIEFTTRGGA
ncbi:MAG TPA: pantoate--beta-alanine ligase [Marmoricola sp.]